MKENFPTTYRRLFAVILAVFMLVGQFSTVFAAITAEDDGHIDYVTFGASVTNGYGLRGYLPDEVVADPLLADKNTLNVFGFDRAPAEGYPALVAKELESRGYEVDLKQYAISSMRVEELRVLLDDEYYGDEYTAWRFYNSSGNGWFKQATTVWEGGEIKEHGSLEKTRKLYQDAVKNSELITIEIGVNNFGVYTFNNIEEIVASGGESYWKAPEFSDLLTEEEQKKFDEAKQFVLDELKKAGTDEKMMNIADKMANVLAYATVGYMRNFDKVMEKIYELNGEANVVVITIQNLMEGVDMKLNGVTIPIGEIYGALIDTANMYTAVGSPYADRYGYAVASSDDLATTFLDELLAYNGDPSTLSDSMKDCFDMYDDNLYLRSKLQYIIAPWMVMQQKPYNIQIDLGKLGDIAFAGIDDVNAKRWDLPSLAPEERQIFGLLIDILGAGAMFEFDEYTPGPDSTYFSLVYDVKHYEESDHKELRFSETFNNALGAAYNVAAEIMQEFGKVTLMEVDIENFAEDYASAQSMLINYITTSAFEEAIAVLMGEESSFEVDEGIFEDENIVASAVLLLRFMVGNSFFAHPNAEGHEEVKDAIILAMDHDLTGKDAAIIETRDALMYLAGLIAENGPEIAEEIYKYAEKNGYIDDVKAALKDLEKEVYDELKKYAESIVPDLENKIKKLDKYITEKIDRIEELKTKAQEEIIPYLDTLKNDLAKAKEEYDKVMAHIDEYHGEEKAALIASMESVITAIEKEITTNEAVLGQINSSVAVLEKETEGIRAVVDELTAKFAEIGTEVEKLVVIAGDIITNVKELLSKTFENADKEILESEIKKIISELEATANEIIDAALYAETTWHITQRVTLAAENLCDKLAPSADALKEFVDDDVNLLISELTALLDSATPAAEESIREIIADVKEIGGIGEELALEISEVADIILKEAENLAGVIADEVIKAIEELKDAVKNAYANAITGEYAYSADSYYVNIGDSITKGSNNYAVKFATELGLEEDQFVDLGNAEFRTEDIRYILDENYTPDAYGKAVVKNVEALRKQYITEIEKADIITVGVGNLTPFVFSQLLADIKGDPYEADWAKLVGKDHVQYIEAALEEVRAYLAEADIPTVPVVNIDIEGLLMTVVENYAYAYMGFAFNYAELVNDIHAINPDAEVVLIGAYNALEDLEIEGTSFGEYIDYLIELMDLQFTVYGMLTPNTTFVEVNDVIIEEPVEGIADLVMTILNDQTPAVNPSEAGHEYIKTQILDAISVTYYGLGDVNLDGEVDAKDATQILRYINGKTSVFDTQNKYKSELIRHNADVDYNVGIEAKDATQILRYCNGKTNTIEGRQ